MFKYFIIIFWIAVVSPALAETGYATYYGSKFIGRKTASGERYNPGDLTCAHKSRPLCSLAMVKGMGCAARSYVTVRWAGKAVQCRVNDRGPFSRGAVIDLSLAAARRLGMVRAGRVKVSLD